MNFKTITTTAILITLVTSLVITYCTSYVTIAPKIAFVLDEDVGEWVMFTKTLYLRVTSLIYERGTLLGFGKFFIFHNATTDPVNGEFHDLWISFKNCNVSITNLWVNKTFNAILNCKSGQVWELIINNPYNVMPRVTIDDIEAKPVSTSEFQSCVNCFVLQGRFIRVKGLGSTHRLTIDFNPSPGIVIPSNIELRLPDKVSVGDRVIFVIVLYFSQALTKHTLLSYELKCIRSDGYSITKSGSKFLSSGYSMYTISDFIVFNKEGNYTCVINVQVGSIKMSSNPTYLTVVSAEEIKPQLSISFNTFMLIFLLILLIVLIGVLIYLKRKTSFEIYSII